MAPEACPRARAAADQLREDLARAGIGVIALEGVRLAARVVETLTTPVAASPPASIASSEGRARAATFVEIRYRDGRRERLGPTTRAWAEVVLGDLNVGHAADVAGARLIAEPSWIARTLDDLLAEDAA